jgi:hypothetical protein
VRLVLGSPANGPSIWVKRLEFTHEYREFGGLWLPASHRSRAELKVTGTSTLEIDYGGYQWAAQGGVPVSSRLAAATIAVSVR